MIKNITKIIFACLIAGILFNACKKDSNKEPIDKSPPPPMKYTINDATVSYDNCFLSFLTGTKSTLVVGFDSKNVYNEFEIDILADYTTLSAGQTFPVKANDSELNTAELYFAPDTAAHFTSQSVVSEGTVTITATTATTIIGTFSGKLYIPDDTGGANLKYTITNGSFIAKRPN